MARKPKPTLQSALADFHALSQHEQNLFCLILLDDRSTLAGNWYHDRQVPSDLIEDLEWLLRKAKQSDALRAEAANLRYRLSGSRVKDPQQYAELTRRISAGERVCDIVRAMGLARNYVSAVKSKLRKKERRA